MSDDIIDDDFDEEPEDDLDEDLDEELEAEDEDDDDEVALDEDVIAGDDDLVDGDDDEEEAETGETPRRKPLSEDDEEEEEEDDDDVEADLDTILIVRIASGVDEDDDVEEEDIAPVDPRGIEGVDGVTAKRDGEFTCDLCFMVVHPRQFGRKESPRCPYGEEDCPSIAVAFGC